MTFNLLLRSVGRVLWFAVAGATCMAVVGIVAGSVTGALLVLLQNLTRLGTARSIFRDMPLGALVGAATAFYVGVLAGAVAFGSAGTIACFSSLPKKVFGASWRLAWRSTLIGTFLGGVLGTLNALVFGRWISAFDDFDGYVYGVISGFIIGTFYGAITGALREIARQRNENAQQNAALSSTESTAL